MLMLMMSIIVIVEMNMGYHHVAMRVVMNQ